MAGPSTNMEALLAELLGDVGRVHDEIKALPDQLAPTLGALVTATEQLQDRANTLSENAKAQHDAHAQRVVATYADRIGEVVEARVNEALNVRVGNVTRQLEQAIQQTNAAASEYVKAARSPWLTLGGAWLVAIIVGAAAGLASCVGLLYATGQW